MAVAVRNVLRSCGLCSIICDLLNVFCLHIEKPVRSNHVSDHSEHHLVSVWHGLGLFHSPELVDDAKGRRHCTAECLVALLKRSLLLLINLLVTFISVDNILFQKLLLWLTYSRWPKHIRILFVAEKHHVLGGTLHAVGARITLVVDVTYFFALKLHLTHE